MIVKAALGVFDSLCEKFEQSLQFFRFQLMKEGGEEIRLDFHLGGRDRLTFFFPLKTWQVSK